MTSTASERGRRLALSRGLASAIGFEAHHRVSEEAGSQSRLGLACASRELRELIDDARLDVEPVELPDDRCFVFQVPILLTLGLVAFRGLSRRPSWMPTQAVKS